MFEIVEFKVVIEKMKINFCMINGRILHMIDDLLQGNEKQISINVICLCKSPYQ